MIIIKRWKNVNRICGLNQLLPDEKLWKLCRGGLIHGKRLQ